MRLVAGRAGFIDATMIKIADGLALTAGTVQAFVQRQSDSKWLNEDNTWTAGEPVGAAIPVLTHVKGSLWHRSHTPQADVADVYSVSAVDSPVTCYQDDRDEPVDLPPALEATVSGVPAAVFAYVVENGKTFLQVVRIMFAALKGKTSGGGKNFRDDADTKNRIESTIDANGDRTAVVLDGD